MISSWKVKQAALELAFCKDPEQTSNKDSSQNDSRTMPSPRVEEGENDGVTGVMLEHKTAQGTKRKGWTSEGRWASQGC